MQIGNQNRPALHRFARRIHRSGCIRAQVHQAGNAAFATNAARQKQARQGKRDQRPGRGLTPDTGPEDAVLGHGPALRFCALDAGVDVGDGFVDQDRRPIATQGKQPEPVLNT